MTSLSLSSSSCGQPQAGFPHKLLAAVRGISPVTSHKRACAELVQGYERMAASRRDQGDEAGHAYYLSLATALHKATLMNQVR